MANPSEVVVETRYDKTAKYGAASVRLSEDEDDSGRVIIHDSEGSDFYLSTDEVTALHRLFNDYVECTTAKEVAAG